MVVVGWLVRRNNISIHQWPSLKLSGFDLEVGIRRKNFE